MVRAGGDRADGRRRCMKEAALKEATLKEAANAVAIVVKYAARRLVKER